LAEKIDRKQLRQPDEFQVWAGKSMGWVVAHQRQVVLVTGAVVVAALLGWAASAWRSSREEKAGGALAQALEIQSRPIAGEAPPQEGVETFPTKEDRSKAALEALEKVRADNTGTAAATTAIAQTGFLKLRAGDAAGAQKDLTDFLAQAGKDHPLRVFAQESLGYAYEAQNKIDDARSAFDKLRELGLPARADFQAARLSLVQGKPDAKQQLERVTKDFPKEPEVVRAANERIELASLPPVPAGYVAPAPTISAPKEAPKAPEKPAAKPGKPAPPAKKKK
jgi:tetratricopeptide (TPR) repeat protein